MYVMTTSDVSTIDTVVGFALPTARYENEIPAKVDTPGPHNNAVSFSDDGRDQPPNNKHSIVESIVNWHV